MSFPAAPEGQTLRCTKSPTIVESDIEQLLDSVAAESGSKLLRRDDSFGYSWVVVQDADLEDQVTAAHAVAQGLEEQGFGEQLLAAVFKFDGAKHPVYLVYG